MLRIVLRYAQTAGLVLSLGTAGAVGASESEPVAKPYAMRGVELGITLDEFRSFPIPHDDEQTYDLQARCTDTGLNGAHQINWRYPAQEDGVINCGWFSHSKVAFASKSLTELWVQLGAGRGAPQFQFVEQEGKYRLFRISVKAHTSFYAGIPDALTRNFGTPATSVEPFQVLSGATYPATTLAWDNGLSTISLVDRCEELNRYCLTYEHAELKKLYDALIDRRGAAAASKI